MVNNLAGTREFAVPLRWTGGSYAVRSSRRCHGLLVDAYSIALGLTEQRVTDVLGELVLGNIGQDAASVDPADRRCQRSIPASGGAPSFPIGWHHRLRRQRRSRRKGRGRW